MGARVQFREWKSVPTEPPCAVEQLGGLQYHFNAVLVAMVRGSHGGKHIQEENIHVGVLKKRNKY